jgi:hypothetical protein
MMLPMGTAQNPAGTRSVMSAAEWAGYLGVVPLIACLAIVGLASNYAVRELAERGAIAWGALLLAFTAAVHWGLALAGALRCPTARLAVPLAFVPLAGAAVLLGGQRALALLVVGHGILWLYEHRVLGEALPPLYLALRRQLAIAICMLLALTMFVCDSAGLA